MPGTKKLGNLIFISLSGTKLQALGSRHLWSRSTDVNEMFTSQIFNCCCCQKTSNRPVASLVAPPSNKQDFLNQIDFQPALLAVLQWR